MTNNQLQQQKIKLAPPRKWYTLEQASRKLSKETGQDITVEDMVHYLFLGYFLPYLHVKYQINKEITFNNKYTIELNSKNKLKEHIPTTKKLSYSDLVVLSDYCNLAIQGIDYPVNYTTKWLEYYVENLLEQMANEYGELNDETMPYIIENFFTKNKKLTFGIDGLLAVKIECLYNGTPLLSEEIGLFENGLPIKNQDLLTPPMIEIDYRGLLLTLDLEYELYIPANEIIIVYDDVLRIQQDIRANLRYFAENADKNGLVPDNEQIYIYGQEQKTIEKTPPRMEKSKTQTPEQYKKEYARKLVIDSCIATMKDYPTAGKNTLVKAVIECIKADPTIENLEFQHVRTYTDALDKKGLKFPDEKGKRIEISNVTIVKP